MNFFEKKLSGKTVYDGKILKLEVDEVELPDGNKSTRECIRHCDGAAVLLVEDGKILLVKQYRYLYGKVMYEIPAGKLESGEDPKAGGARELEEETGYSAELVRLMELYPSVGYTDEVIHIFIADNFEYVGRNPDKDEFVESEFISVCDVLAMIERGEICDAKTVAAVYKYVSGK